MTIRTAIKIMQMSKKAMKAKYGRTATSRFIDAKLKIKEAGLSMKKAKSKAFSRSQFLLDENVPVSNQMTRDMAGRNLRRQAKKKALDS